MIHVRHLVSAAAVVSCVGLGVGCGDSESAGASCVPGKQEACACAGGGQGVQVCASDRTWGACEGCSAVGADVVDGSGDAGDTSDRPDGFGAVEVINTPGDATVTPTPDGASGDIVISEGCDPCGYGELLGIVCAPAEQIYIAGATITMHVKDCDGELQTLTTQSDADGLYRFPQVPCGLHTVQIDAGQFHTEFVTSITPGHTTDITGAGRKQCFKANQVKIAAFWGQWDEMHLILDTLGLSYTWYNFEWDFFNDTNPADIEALQVLRDPVQLTAYDILFFNCGSAALDWVEGFPEIRNNLKNFVLGGGSLYASDLAWAYLEGAFPNAVDFLGADDFDDPQQVMAHQQVPATVEDATLAQYLGTGSFTAEYGSGPLIGVTEVGTGSTVHVRGLVKIEDSSFQGYHIEGQPVVVSHHPGGDAGRVIYTSFHNDDQADALMEQLLYYLVFLL